MSDTTSDPASDAPSLTPREKRALAMIAGGSDIRRFSDTEWSVPSASDTEKRYMVRKVSHGATLRWHCSCPDHETRLIDCKHIHAVKFVHAIRSGAPLITVTETVSQTFIVERAERRALPSVAGVACKHCGGANLKRGGFRSGKQLYRCLSDECGRAFVLNEGFARLKADPKAICLALDLHFKGNSLRQVTDTLSQFFEIHVDHTTVYRWITRYVALINEYAASLAPQVGDKWHADEVFTKFAGDMQYLWHVMDAETRYLLVSKVTDQRDDADAKTVMGEAFRLAGKAPREIVTDGLPAYIHGVKARLPGARHTREIHISKPDRYPQNNRVERLNGTVRQRQKVARGLKKPQGPLSAGQAAYYNLIRPHQALNGKTPAEAAGIQIPSEAEGGKWAGLIRAAVRRQDTECNSEEGGH